MSRKEGGVTSGGKQVNQPLLELSVVVRALHGPSCKVLVDLQRQGRANPGILFDSFIILMYGLHLLYSVVFGCIQF